MTMIMMMDDKRCQYSTWLHVIWLTAEIVEFSYIIVNNFFNFQVLFNNCHESFDLQVKNQSYSWRIFHQWDSEPISSALLGKGHRLFLVMTNLLILDIEY